MEKTINTPYPFVALQDLAVSLDRLAPGLDREFMARQEAELFSLERKYAPDGSTFYAISSEELAGQTEGLVDQYVRGHQGRVGMLCLDKDLFRRQPREDLFRLQFSRSPAGESVSRVGIALSPAEQIDRMTHWISEGSFDEIVLVDDVLAFGETTQVIVDAIRRTDENIALRHIVGIASKGGIWRGVERAVELTAQTPITMYTVHASREIEGGSKGMAIPTSRDLTLLGGKISRAEDGSSYSYPYFLPFSQPLGSIVRPDRALEASKELLGYNHRLFRELGRLMGRSLTIQDMVIGTYGIPSSTFEEYAPRLQEKTRQVGMLILDLIEYAAELLDESESR